MSSNFPSKPRCMLTCPYPLLISSVSYINIITSTVHFPFTSRWHQPSSVLSRISVHCYLRDSWYIFPLYTYWSRHRDIHNVGFWLLRRVWNWPRGWIHLLRLELWPSHGRCDRVSTRLLVPMWLRFVSLIRLLVGRVSILIFLDF